MLVRCPVCRVLRGNGGSDCLCRTQSSGRVTGGRVLSSPVVARGGNTLLRTLATNGEVRSPSFARVCSFECVLSDFRSVLGPAEVLSARDDQSRPSHAPGRGQRIDRHACLHQVSVLCVVGTGLVADAAERHKTSPTATAALGRNMLGTLLLAAFGKDEAVTQVTFRGNGPLGQSARRQRALGPPLRKISQRLCPRQCSAATRSRA